MLLLIISLADQHTLESLLKQSFALFPTFGSTFQIIVRSGTYQFLMCYVLRLVAQFCLSPCDLIAAHQAPLSMGILQARRLEWAAMPSSKGMNQGSNSGLPALQADSLPLNQ